MMQLVQIMHEVAELTKENHGKQAEEWVKKTKNVTLPIISGEMGLILPLLLFYSKKSLQKWFYLENVL